ncbi:D-alanyl-D-alanine carboxypeptidase DacF precursor [Pseudooceanicola marinus]|uniref:D-alanyl-D-alanine carboxypeptidase DacF n=2 Tax=Pseudooceanicola marinus TaxID=396013 RepID=A0A1X6ZJL1_9RHOB|nr:D-alanyl-D-alanine carboxypeptidase DacF precursor [Pseudooceanicola marinus]
MSDVVVRRRQPALDGLFRTFVTAFLALVLVAFWSPGTQAAPYAEMVVDARTGEVLRSRNADTRLHPASLTKMMTLYIAFEAVEHGEISLDTQVRVSRNAANEVPSKLGLREGQRIKLRYLIRAAAVKSANDAATAIGEAIEGSEAAFARRMNRTAEALGMTRTTFKNANGLTSSGHLSTARDMTTLGRHLYFDYPEYYHLFSKRTADAGGTTVYNTNRKFLAAYRGADGIKTGYTRAAGFNLVASAARGNERIIATIFGGRSTPWRNARMAELLDLGFERAPSSAPTIAPAKPVYGAQDELLMAGKTVRVNGAPRASLRPRARPIPDTSEDTPDEMLLASLPDAATLDAAAAEALAFADTSAGQTLPLPEDPAQGDAAVETAVAATPAILPSGPVENPIPPMARPSTLLKQFSPAQPAQTTEAQQASLPADVGVAVTPVVTRSADAGPASWGVNIGRFTTEGRAERILLTTALAEVETLEGADRRVVRSPTGFDANFAGLTRDAADRTCRRLNARNQTCFMIGPDT